MVMGYGGLGRSRPPRPRASIRVMYGYIRPHRLPLLAGGLLSLATGATGLLLPLVVRALINDLSRHRGLSGLIVIMCLLVAADAGLGAAGNYVLLRTAETIVLNTRKNLIDRLLRITIGALDGSEPGDLMARATVDTTLLRGVVSNAVIPALTGALTAVAALVLMGLVDAALLGVTAAAVGCIVVLESVVLPRIGQATRKTQEAVGAMTAALERMFGAFRTVKASGAEAREGARLHAAAIQAWRASLRADFWQAVVGNTTELAVQFAFLAVLATGGAQVASGSISVGTLVDGTDTHDWPLGPLRAAIGYVEQDAPVLSGTLRENLLFGAPEASAEQLAGVLAITRLRDLTDRLPDGLETYVGHRGTRLSGGERQRVAIARALLRRPRLLLLDEATSQLDAINEAALRETVADVARLITVLVVAHRLSTVTMADRIIVMDAGQVQATGTHAELVAACPLYAELAATQFLATSG